MSLVILPEIILRWVVHHVPLMVLTCSYGHGYWGGANNWFYWILNNDLLLVVRVVDLVILLYTPEHLVMVMGEYLQILHQLKELELIVMVDFM